ncbi:MAG: hypothetical protein OXC69_07255 [Candidatus Tectomicrobia bacterium]|nr:hypothetical protein [Candidatus Tectomicrobia bacterium]
MQWETENNPDIRIGSLQGDGFGNITANMSLIDKLSGKRGNMAVSFSMKYDDNSSRIENEKAAKSELQNILQCIVQAVK